VIRALLLGMVVLGWFFSAEPAICFHLSPTSRLLADDHNPDAGAKKKKKKKKDDEDREEELFSTGTLIS